MKLMVFGWGRFGLCVLGGVCIGVVVGGIFWPFGPPMIWNFVAVIMFILVICLGFVATLLVIMLAVQEAVAR